MTFSIAARCPVSGMVGVAVTSSSPSVAARCAHVAAGAGAVASQNITDPGLGILGLELLAAGHAAAEVIARLVAATPFSSYRQLAVVDAQGRTGFFSGSGTLGTYAAAEGAGCVAVGNLLADAGVPAAMIAGFAAAEGHLAARLIAGLAAGEAAGGEEGPVRSAGVVVADRLAWPVVDLRVDWHDQPLAALQQVWDVYGPQVDDYVRRAVDPSAAPSFGVPGDL